VILPILALPVVLAQAEPVDHAAQEVLRDPSYRFCHEADYPLDGDEHAWCPLVPDRSEACPALPAACKAAPVERPEALALREARPSRRGDGSEPAGRDRRGAGQGAGSGQGKGDGQAGGPRPDEDTRTRPPPPEKPKPQTLALSGFAQVLFFVLLGVFVVVVARALFKNFVRDRRDDDPDEEAPAPKAEAALAAPRGPVETDVERLLGRARAAAGRGEYGRAIDDAYAALLRRLDGDGLIEIHASRTNGDYVRLLREKPELKRAVRDIVRDVERVQFGDAAPSERAFETVLARVVPLVSRTLGAALLCAGLSAALSCAPHDRAPAPRAASSRGDTSPSGTAALAATLEKHGFKVRYRAEPIAALERQLTLVVLPGAVFDEASWQHVLGWVRERGGTLVLASAAGAPDELGLRSVTDPEPSPRLEVDGAPRTVIASPSELRLVDHDGARPDDGVMIHRGASVIAVDRRLGAGRILVFADDRLFSNIALTVAENAAFMVGAFRLFQGSTDIEFCDGWTGAGAATPFESVARAELTPVILQLLALLALLYVWKGKAFARLRDPPAEARRSFADHARALGLAYSRARASRHVVGLYAVWALDRLRERVHRAGRQGLIPLAEAISARTGRPEAEVMSTLVEASSARDEAAPPSSFRTGPRSARDISPKRARDEGEADTALIRELQSFLDATGQRQTAAKANPDRK
jgi:hypothetical protein